METAHTIDVPGHTAGSGVRKVWVVQLVISLPAIGGSVMDYQVITDPDHQVRGAVSAERHELPVGTPVAVMKGYFVFNTPFTVIYQGGNEVHVTRTAFGAWLRRNCAIARRLLGPEVLVIDLDDLPPAWR